jgi:hypothetical protein
MNKKQIKKNFDKKCYFCECDNYKLLDLHRIKYGEHGGKYTDYNTVTVCALCHRKIHAGIINILGKHFSSNGKYVIHYIYEGKEEWK